MDRRQPGFRACYLTAAGFTTAFVVCFVVTFVAVIAAGPRTRVLRQGLCDDLLSTLCLARECPLLVAPAMNLQMWGNPATQRNVEQLRADGVGDDALARFFPELRSRYSSARPKPL